MGKEGLACRRLLGVIYRRARRVLIGYGFLIVKYSVVDIMVALLMCESAYLLWLRKSELNSDFTLKRKRLCYSIMILLKFRVGTSP